MRLIKYLFLIVFIVAGSVVTFQLAGTSGGTEIIGDRAPEVAEALGNPPQTEATPTLSAVLVENWGKLMHIEGAVADCGTACAPGIDLVRVISLDPRRSRKTLYLRTSGPLAEPACAAQMIEAEATDLVGPRTPPFCAQDALSATIWVLPFGLGRL